LVALSGKVRDLELGLDMMLKRVIEAVLFGKESWSADEIQMVCNSIQNVPSPLYILGINIRTQLLHYIHTIWK